MHGPVHSADRRIWRDGKLGGGARLIPEETAIALTDNGGTYAVMMGTPQDLRDFAVGFSLSEGILTGRDELMDVGIVESAAGIEVQMAIAVARFGLLRDRRRTLAGRTGCGICGVESLEQAVRPVPPVTAVMPKGKLKNKK